MLNSIPTLIVPVSVSRALRGWEDGTNPGFLRRVDFPHKGRSVFLSIHARCPSLSESNLELWEFVKSELSQRNFREALLDMVTWEIYREVKTKRDT